MTNPTVFRIDNDHAELFINIPENDGSPCYYNGALLHYLQKLIPTNKQVRDAITALCLAQTEIENGGKSLKDFPLVPANSNIRQFKNLVVARPRSARSESMSA